MIGKTLGHYEILAPLGEGGMGQVFQESDGVRFMGIELSPVDAGPTFRLPCMPTA